MGLLDLFKQKKLTPSQEEQLTNKIASTQEQMQKIQKVIDSFNAKADYITNDMTRQETMAKAFIKKGLKAQAMQCLKKKKTLSDKQIGLFNKVNYLQSTCDTLESRLEQQQLYIAVKTAVEAGQSVNQDELEKVMDQMDNMKMDLDMVNETVNNSVGNEAIDVDEDYEALLKEMAAEDAVSAPSIPSAATPAKPVAAKPNNQTVEDDELAAIASQL
ncbi:hypothetical protein WA158_006436 [Blastocystis sp. Blastoise]